MLFASINYLSIIIVITNFTIQNLTIFISDSDFILFAFIKNLTKYFIIITNFMIKDLKNFISKFPFFYPTKPIVI